MSSTRKQQVAERVLDSIRTRFSKAVSNVWNGIDVRKQLHAPAASGTDHEALFKRNHDLFRSGLEAWMESLVKITQEWVPMLARIASRDPSLATDDPARWARCCVQEMLGKGLGIVVIGPDAAVPPSFHVKKVRSTIERWIMHVCDNGPDFDRSESGYHEPWRAPVWTISFCIRKGRPDRLTVEQTELVVRSAENMFIGRLDYVLGDAEDQARVDLAKEFASRELPQDESSEDGKRKDVVSSGGISSIVSHPKPVREGKTVDALYEQLKKMRNLYRNNGWTYSQIRSYTHAECRLMWEWVDRIDSARRDQFVRVDEWEDGAKFIFLQIETLYRYAPHLMKKPSWSTLRDWRKAYRRMERSSDTRNFPQTTPDYPAFSTTNHSK